MKKPGASLTPVETCEQSVLGFIWTYVRTDADRWPMRRSLPLIARRDCPLSFELAGMSNADIVICGQSIQSTKSLSRTPGLLSGGPQ